VTTWYLPAVLFVRRPTGGTLDRLLGVARAGRPTYAEVGATEEEAFPGGYRHDEDELRLGGGEDRFVRAVSAVRGWQAQLGAGVEVVPAGARVVDGQTVLLLIRAAGLWTVAPCRVVYVREEADRFAFAYGTLPGHPEQGEVSFSVTRGAEGEIVFRVASFSRPVDRLARLARPLSRRIQRRVTLEYLSSIKRAAG
jgi:uncharacterized protein (UPF0548 family)